jgi:eukaryotic-like serine/threonine-protein kinase
MIGDYQIVGFLGQGGMGAVYRVRNVIADREEALKVLLADFSTSPDLSARFLREIQIHASLHHPNIAAMRTAFRVDDQLVMVMEFVDGITLGERLRQGPISISQGVGWIDKALSGLQYAHANGVIHRDIKPANIIITAADGVKLMDFGIARSVADPGLTGTAVAIGSVSYMSPEVIQAAEPDSRSDLYSVGITLFELLTGRRPFIGNNNYEVMKAHLDQSATSPDAINPNVPAALASVVLRAMAKQREDRFQTADEFLSALKPFSPLSASDDTVFDLAAIAPEPKQGSAQSGTTSQSLLPSFETSTKSDRSTGFSGGPSRADIWDQSVLERVAKELSSYIGPVGRVLVHRAAKNCSSLDELSQTLAAEIPLWNERQKFLNSLSGVWSKARG